MDRSTVLEETRAKASRVPDSLASRSKNVNNNENNDQDKTKSPRKSSQKLAQQLTAQLTGRGHLISSQQTIEKLQADNLSLKIQLSDMRKKFADRDRQMAEFAALNKALEKELEETKKRKITATRESCCQTNLDSLNMDEFMKARITLKRYMESQSMQAPQNTKPQPPPPQPIITEIQYPNDTRPNMVINEDLHPDEKAILDRLYYVLGLNMNSLDRLKAKQSY